MRRCPGRRSDRPPNFGPVYGRQKQSPPLRPAKKGLRRGLLNSYKKTKFKENINSIFI